MATVHIESAKEDIANIVLMPGDPKRSEYIAKNYLKDYKLVNSVRGITAYTGYYKDRLVTIFPSGMGNASMGIYSYELFKEYDVDYIIRIGSCGAYCNELKLKDIILTTGSYSLSTYAMVLDDYKEKEIDASRELNLIIKSCAINSGISLKEGKIYCSDAFYEKDYDYNERVRETNTLGIEMETFALFNNARHFNKKATALLTVSDTFFSSEKLSSLEREKNLNEMIELALNSCLKL